MVLSFYAYQCIIVDFCSFNLINITSFGIFLRLSPYFAVFRRLSPSFGFLNGPELYYRIVSYRIARGNSIRVLTGD